MVVFEQSGCIWAKVVVFWQGVCYLAKWLYSGKVDVIGQCGCNRASICIRAKWLYSGNVVVFRQSGCTLAKWMYSGKIARLGKNGCIREK